MGNVIINGMEYYQPECHCVGSGHICYLRPVPTIINVPIEKILSNFPASGRGAKQPTPKLRQSGVGEASPQRGKHGKDTN